MVRFHEFMSSSQFWTLAGLMDAVYCGPDIQVFDHGSRAVAPNCFGIIRPQDLETAAGTAQVFCVMLKVVTVAPPVT
jgi:hypothetical protein